MDDYLQSFPSIEEAKRVSSEVNHVHKKARFELRGWATNEPEVIGKKEREGVTVPIGGSEIEKTLGLLWDTREDSIRFKLNTRRAPPEVIKGQRPPTKREALSIIMSIFDPLGLISPVTTPAKRIMQDTWRYTTAWDEEIPEELRERWGNWLQHLRDLGDLSIPRCYDTAPAPKYELHTFVDASEEAYAAAVYWRMTRADGTTKVALAAAKSRVTPTRLVSIPRLELQAAVLGVRLAEAVGNEHDFEIDSRTYWSDARTALAWIRSEPRTYKSFVAHRLAEIEDYTKKDEWRWVPSAHNVADDATRAAPSDFDTRHRWFTGPAFLYEPEEAWPQENKMKIEPTGEEKEVCCSVATPRKSRAAVPAIENFSKWTSLLRTAARVLQFIDLLRERQKSRASLATQCIAAARRKRTRANKDGDSTWGKRDKRAPVVPKTVENSRRRKYIILEARYLLAAEKVLVRTSQEDSYARERKRIAEGLAPNKDDRLAKLSVYLDEDDIIRQRGRIAAADDISEDAVHPIVLCGKHHYTYLYVSHVHERLHHGGTETVVNELRQRVYIPKIRPAVKKVIARCPECRLRKAKPAGPPTGDLPAARLGHHLRPFTYTGLDYFGPLEVTVGRHREKRYVALFTCMTSRAIHLEVAASLTTDSAINALRRFIARRGCPTELWSDNGTAFKGANRELTEAMREAAHARRINWRFLPPSSPFMAGVWERMVRSVKEALKTTLHERCPSDETLHTLMAEVEATVNSRPLTYVATDPEDPPALTPNMILLGPDCHSPAPGDFKDSDESARQHWRRAQYLADTFWRRWVREYAPLLQHRREPRGEGVEPAVGDVVIVCDNNLPRNTWPRGRVTQTYPGKDGVVRVVDVTTSRGHVLRRPTKKIVVLPVGSHGDGGRNVNDARDVI
ncbi:uncharacterized protein LOC125229808 [Leguminivora glycinivorella]|uniref:uncharacterized protein LOC125229808 n=1 Tax=Leguminivora glycinivorella TaxID=1035111 RepID=UPI00200CE1B8|nr:uncharacterized protein LOC125229808 [Leguminivora glycinivorella]